MQNPPGAFIVIEGSDGSGKGTQFKLLTERLKAVGYEVAIFDFPQYDKPSSYFVRSYLKGDYGPASSISPYTASLFYAMDRFEAAPEIRKALEAGKIVISNRFVGSNMAHQGSKFSDSVEQRSFFVWEDSLEYQLLGIPRPSANIFLRVPAEVSQKLIIARSAKTGVALDEHEKDIGHLAKSVATYDALCKIFPKDFKAIECIADGQLLSIPAINDLIWQTIKPLLPANPRRKGHGVTVKLGEQPAAKKLEPAPKQASAHQTTSTERLRIDLNGFSHLALSNLQSPTDADLIIRTNWSPKRGFAHYTPKEFKPELAKTYKASLKKQADLYNQIDRLLAKLAKGKPEVVKEQVDAALQAITPMSATANATLAVDKVSLGRLLKNLGTLDYKEVRHLGEVLQTTASKQWPAEFSKTLPQKSASVPEPISQIIAKIGSSSLTSSHGDSDSAVKLLEARPRNELDLLADCLYPYTNLPGVEIVDEIEGWTYNQKAKTFKAAVLGSSPALSQAIYKFDVVGTRQQLAELTSVGLAANLQVQALTPRYGYEVPEILEQTGAEDLFLDCFDESLGLFSQLQAAGLDRLTPYATLQGHKLRWQFSVDAGSLMALANKSDFINSLVAKIVEAHPLIYEVLESLSARR